ncbi:hypothetical protein L226DRAFT_511835 [Lentinus tigrinus ALCF2SS1-7]|uniref:uncharacterized protein n=1 Tax=Lentinus tigrinus ALCF2SS1-7 TaxID=1328758 RepID=UPI001165C9E0|nr:hypothetical protein L226DRAFT_511835 [Lentinus tigrinus ALCF2SS1-7]
MLNLLSLNDDVLLSIVANLHGQDALNVSLTAKRAYALAGHRIPSHIRCSSPLQLRRLHAYLLSTLPNGAPRIAFLEQFVIDASTFETPDRDPTYYASDFSQAHLIGDILLQAQNLRELSVERCQPYFAHDPRIGEAVRSLDNLVNVRLSTIADSTLTIFDPSRSHHIARLTLFYSDLEEYVPVENGSMSLPPLVSLLSSCPHLRTVILSNFTPKTGLSRDETLSLPSFPSIQDLRLCGSSGPSLDLVELCPNLSTLVVSLARASDVEPDVDVELIVSKGSKWPPLRRLIISQYEDVLSFYERLNTVNQLQISDLLHFNLNPDSALPAVDSLPHFLAFLHNTSPVGLFMCMRGCMETDVQRALWNDIPRVVPRLRSLELQLRPPSDNDDLDYYSWLDKLTVALPSLPLVCLRVLVFPEEDSPDMWYKAEEWESGLRRLGERAASRLQKLAELPNQLVRSLPSLRYLALGDTAPNVGLVGDAAAFGSAIIRARQVQEDNIVWECDELRRMLSIRKHQQSWWRVVNGPHGRELLTISEKEGEEAQRLIETMTDSDTTHMEEALKALSL